MKHTRTRRGRLVAAGLLALIAVAAGCGDDSSSAATPAKSTTTTAAATASTTTAPAFTAMGAYCLEMPLPAENSAISTPLKESSFNSSIVSSWPRKVCF